MPYALRRTGSGWKVANRITGKTYSRNPLPRKRAVAQLRAIMMRTGGR